MKVKISTKKIKWIIIILAILFIEVLLGSQIKPSLKGIGEPISSIDKILGIIIPGGINYTTILVTWLIMGIMILSGWLITRKLEKIPRRLQAFGEKTILALEHLCQGSLGSRQKGRIFLPFIGTLFGYVLFANWLSIIPISGLESPTGDINTPVALAVLVFLVSHVSGIKYKGFKSYVLEFFEPMIVIKKVRIPNPFMGILNIVGEFGKVISHSFRLFGNVLGGAIIVFIISNLLRYILMPVALKLFFDLFIGGLQAFIFGMLGLTYISLLAGE